VLTTFTLGNDCAFAAVPFIGVGLSYTDGFRGP